MNREAREILDEIFGPVLKSPASLGAIRMVGGPDEPKFRLYRARVAYDRAAVDRILASPVTELGPPPPSLRTSGRMNPAGVGVLYAALDPTTAAAEVRAIVGAQVVVGSFEAVRPLRVLDLTRVRPLGFASYFASDLTRQKDYGDFLRELAALITRPVMPAAEQLDYVPTQYVAEYLATVAKPELDGIVYPSALVNQDCAISATTDEIGRNLVLFARSAGFEADKEGLPVGPAQVSYYGRDDEDDALGTMVYLNAGRSKSDFVDDAMVSPGESKLRLKLDETRVRRVRSISYSLGDERVSYTPASSDEAEDGPEF